MSQKSILPSLLNLLYMFLNECPPLLGVTSGTQEKCWFWVCWNREKHNIVVVIPNRSLRAAENWSGEVRPSHTWKESLSGYLLATSWVELLHFRASLDLCSNKPQLLGGELQMLTNDAQVHANHKHGCSFTGQSKNTQKSASPVWWAYKVHHP